MCGHFLLDHDAVKWSAAEICSIQLKDRSLKGHSVVGCKAASLELPRVLISVQDLCGLVLIKWERVIMISIISILFIINEHTVSKQCCIFLKECPTMFKACITLVNGKLQKSNATLQLFWNYYCFQ